MAAVARRLGVAPATLRTWDRRYGLGPSGHLLGRHRRYGPRDIARLELMQRALLRGASPAEAARYAMVASAKDLLSGGAQGLLGPADDSEQPAEDAPMLFAGTLDSDQDPTGRVRAGGRVLRLPGASRRARGFGRAVLAMDTVAALGLLAESIADEGVVNSWDHVVRPVLNAIAERWEHSGAGVEVEHLITQCVVAAFSRAAVDAPPPRNPRPVLLSCVPDEQHSLPLVALSTALALRGVGTRLMGAALPADALVSAVRRIAPAAVVLWAQLPRYADVEVLVAVPRTRQRGRLLVAGPGWHDVELPQHVEELTSLGKAVDRIEQVVLGSPRAAR